MYTTLLGRSTEVDWGTLRYFSLCLSRGMGKGPDLTALEAGEAIELELCSDRSLLRTKGIVFKKRASPGQGQSAELRNPWT